MHRRTHTSERRAIGKLIAALSEFSGRLMYRGRQLQNMLVSMQFAAAPGRVFIGKDCIVKGHKYIHLKGSFVALDRNRIEAIDRHGESRFAPHLMIGDGTSMEYDCHIGCVNRVEIGDHVLMASRVYISDHSHGKATTVADLALPPNRRAIFSKGPVVIEDEVWLGEGVAVLPNVRIGRSSIIGANSVVTRDIPRRSIAVGAPARVIRTLD